MQLLYEDGLSVATSLIRSYLMDQFNDRHSHARAAFRC